MFQGTLPYGGWALSLTPIYMKTIKDIISFFLFVLLIIGGLIQRDIALIKVFWLIGAFFVFLMLSFLLSILRSLVPLEILVFGVRGYMSIIYIFIGYYFAPYMKKSIFKAIVVMFIIQFIFQCLEFFSGVGKPVFDEFRNPGFFINPATAGMFSLFMLYISEKIRMKSICTLSILSALLSNSTTALIGVIIFSLMMISNKFKQKKLVVLILFFVVILFMPYLFHFYARGPDAIRSGLTRVGLWINIFNSDFNYFTGNGLGTASSAALLSGYTKAFIADNIYLSALYTMGLTGLMLIMSIFVLLYRKLTNKKLFMILFLYSLTTVVFQINPIVQLVFLFIGFEIGIKEKTKYIGVTRYENVIY